MSKKKTKTRIEKELTHHRLEHLEKNAVIRVSSGSSESKNNDVLNTSKAIKSPLDIFIAKDLRSALIFIGIFVVIVIISGLVVYKTGLANPLLSRWNIKY